jgi:Mrp family chromosome partitioning ATPase
MSSSEEKGEENISCAKEQFERLNPGGSSCIDNVIAVLSGKGGVGKSAVTGITAVALAKCGYRVGVLDADITGPSIPKMFGLNMRPETDTLSGIVAPVETSLGIKVMSLNLLLPEETDPVIWRGPIISNAVKQFWTEVSWGNLDYLLIDLPPGTGDVPLTVMQSLPLDGLVVVLSPQKLAVMVVRKAIKMADLLGIRILGLVENMSYIVCPQCDEKIELFGPSSGAKVSQITGIPLMAVLPVDLRLADLCDKGQVELYDNNLLSGIIEKLFYENVAGGGEA